MSQLVIADLLISRIEQLKLDCVYILPFYTLTEMLECLLIYLLFYSFIHLIVIIFQPHNILNSIVLLFLHRICFFCYYCNCIE